MGIELWHFIEAGGCGDGDWNEKLGGAVATSVCVPHRSEGEALHRGCDLELELCHQTPLQEKSVPQEREVCFVLADPLSTWLMPPLCTVYRLTLIEDKGLLHY